MKISIVMYRPLCLIPILFVGLTSSSLFAQNTNTKTGSNALQKDKTGTRNTADGFDALQLNTSGNDDSAVGYESLSNNVSGSGNTANGSQALFNNTTANYNTAVGYQALYSITVDAPPNAGEGIHNTAVGYQALFHSLTSSPADPNGNTVGGPNTAVGFQALFNSRTSTFETAIGYQALFSHQYGFGTTAVGNQALTNDVGGYRNAAFGNGTLFSNIMGGQNTAIGRQALYNSTGNDNTAVGNEALFSNTGGSNIAIGQSAGHNLTTGDNNIDVGNFDTNSGTSTDVAGEANTIRIGIEGTQAATFIAGIYGATTSDSASTVPVVIDMNGNLGTAASSERFKRDVKPMDSTSNAVLSLKPVTFHYKNDNRNTAQFGLVAEEVAKVNPDLVVRNAKGEIYTVRYDAVNAMLLNEFLKEHRKVEQLEKQVAELTAGLQKVSAEVELNKAAPRTVVTNE